MYKFHDVTDLPSPREELPSEALCLNGAYIEKQIPGYRTLYTIGREGNSREVSQTESSNRDGARFRSVRRESREIRVGFQLESSDARDYARKFNMLKSLLRTEEAQLIFHDESDKFFTGTLTDIDVSDSGELNVCGELVFHCADPYKYAVQEKTVTAAATNGAVEFDLQYDGTVPAYPTFKTITLADTDTLLFSEDTGAMVSVGATDAASAGLSKGSKVFASDGAVLYSGATYPANAVRYAEEYYLMTPVRTPDGTQTLVTVNNTEFLTIENIETTAAEDDSEESEDDTLIEETVDTTAVSGITAYKAIRSTRGVNYICSVQPLFYAEDLREVGYLHFGLISAINEIDGTYNEFEEAEIIIEKTGVGSAYATAKLCIYGSPVKKVRIRVDADNPVTGLDGYGIGISRFGTVYTFALGEEQYEYDASGASSTYAGAFPAYVVCSLARINGYDQMSGIGFGSVQIIATNRTSADQIVDIMRENDTVLVNCETGEIRVNGRPVPNLGSIDNDWTEFCLRPGFNRVTCSSSVSAVSSEPESYTMTYREAWE